MIDLFIFYERGPAFNLHKPPLVFQCLGKKNPRSCSIYCSKRTLLLHLGGAADKFHAFGQVNTSRLCSCADWDLVKSRWCSQWFTSAPPPQKKKMSCIRESPILFQGFMVNGLQCYNLPRSAINYQQISESCLKVKIRCRVVMRIPG